MTSLPTQLNELPRERGLRRLWLSRSAWFRATLFGLLIFACSLGLDAIFHYKHESTAATLTASDAMGGLVAGLLAYKLLHFDIERRRRMEERLIAISDINHHIRNALQVIAFSAQGVRSQQELAEIQDSVDRIQWALREVLPKVEPTFQPFERKPMGRPSGRAQQTK